MVIKFANMDSDWKFSALRRNLPGNTCIEVHLAGIKIYPVIYFCKHLCGEKFLQTFLLTLFGGVVRNILMGRLCNVGCIYGYLDPRVL